VKRKDRYTACIEYFSNAFPNAQTELIYQTPFQLLITVILSAQCTDKRVNAVSPKLFSILPDAAAMAESNIKDIFNLIKSISYPQSKSRYLFETAQLIHNRHKGEVPMHLDELIELPGVGRKTANVILSVLYGKAAMAVDTHVYRVSGRIGLVKAGTSVLRVEQELVSHLPESLVHKAHHWLILHGRYTCLARNPKCTECGLRLACNYFKHHQQLKKMKTKTSKAKITKVKISKSTKVLKSPAPKTLDLKKSKSPAQKAKAKSVKKVSVSKTKVVKSTTSAIKTKFTAHQSALKEGIKAPAFKAQDQNGNRIDSDALKGKNIILYFYPKDDTPGCTKEACNLRDHYKSLMAQNYVVLGVSADDAKSHSKFAKKFNLPFSLLVDTEKQIIKAYDVWGKKQFMGRIYEGVLRNTFVINTKGIISKIIRDVNTEAHSEQIINS
jgi:endonuclease-3